MLTRYPSANRPGEHVLGYPWTAWFRLTLFRRPLTRSCRVYVIKRVLFK